MVLPPGTRERQEIISVIRKNGDFVFNSDRRFNDGSLIVCRRPTPKMRKTTEDFTVCANCKGQYSKSVVRHHFRECAKHDGKNQRIVLVKGKKIAARVHSRASVDVRNKIFPYLREDEVVKSIRYDELVTLYANKMCEKHGTHQHLFQMIGAKLRLLGRFLIAIRKIENRIENFSDVYQPRFYDAAVDAVRVVAKFDPEKKIFDAPAVAAGYGTLLKKMFTCRSHAISTLVVVVAFTIQFIHTQSDVYQYGNKRQAGSSAHKYCGKHLSNALQLICDGLYNPMFKKSGQGIEMDDYPYMYDFPFRTRATANTMMGQVSGKRFRRQSRGVHDECCVKSCSISELTSYCGH
ncbi:uncharacterized protein LOC135168808 [Diachasmimorpha longicaudata]|uniref:uncharacterized protein LOC135168808 n=1 Tax=Diachasmimorpha longicaudata TaxID=58733 RepID=UPI0030B8BC72